MFQIRSKGRIPNTSIYVCYKLALKKKGRRAQSSAKEKRAKTEKVIKTGKFNELLSKFILRFGIEEATVRVVM